MIRILILFAALLFSTVASAQTCPTRPTADSSNACASTAFVKNVFAAGGYIPLTQYHFLIGNASNIAADTILAGDCAYGASGILCTKTNGVGFSYFATGTDAANLTGTLPCSVLPSLTGDVSNTSCATTVQAVQGLAWQATTYSNGQVPVWNSANSRFEPGASAGVLLPAGGRLVAATTNCTSAPAIQHVNISSGAVVCYVAFNTSYVPISSNNYTFTSPLTLTLNATHQTTGHLYDIFAVDSAGAAVICTGPAWTSTTARSLAIARGTSGVITNSATISNCWNGTTDYAGALTAGNATYLGTIYATSNAVVKWEPLLAAAAGGSAPTLGVFNAYNRQPMNVLEQDSTPTWLYSGASVWRAANNSVGNRINFIDGLGDLQSTWEYWVTTSSGGTTSDVSGGTTAVAYDGTLVGSIPITGQIFNQFAFASGASNLALGEIQVSKWFANTSWSSTLGFHYVQAMENTVTSTPGTTFYGNSYSGLFGTLSN